MKIISFLLAFLLSTAIQAQNTSYVGMFPTIDHSADLSSKFGYNVYIFDAIKPYSNNINGFKDEARSFYFYTEAGLSYNITKYLSFTASYVYERQNTFNSYYRNENRLFQQLTLKLPIKDAVLKQRLRFDERFIQNRATGETPFTHRLRYLLGYKLPLNDNLYTFAYNEFFFNTTKGAGFEFNENWSALQMGYVFNKRHGIEAGLLYVGWINNFQKDWLNQYYLQVTWVSHFDFKK